MKRGVWIGLMIVFGLLTATAVAGQFYFQTRSYACGIHGAQRSAGVSLGEGGRLYVTMWTVDPEFKVTWDSANDLRVPLDDNDSRKYVRIKLDYQRPRSSSPGYESDSRAVGSGVGRPWLMASSVGVTMPLYGVAILSGLVSVVAAWRANKNKPVGPGLCVACGYDCRATPERCPECGREFAVGQGA